MNLPFISIAILNWNGKNHLETYLPSVLNTNYPKFEIVVIDNASTDDSVEFLQNTYPSIRLIKLEKNTGYAGGYFHGLKQVDAEIICLLNSDVEVPSNWLDAIGKAFAENKQIGAIQPKILAHQRKDEFEYAGAAGGFIDSLGFPFCRGRIFQEVEKDLGQYDEPSTLFWASGACIFVRNEAYQAAGELDADFFAHMEEIDLCWRIQNAGFQIKYVPESVVYHLGGGTLAYGSPFKTFLNFRNSYYMLHKNLKGFEKFSKIFSHLLLDGIAGIKFLVDRQPSHCWAIVRAHWAYFKAIPSLNAKIKQYPARKPMSTLSGYLSSNLVFNFYVKGKKKFSQLKSQIQF